MTKTVKGAGRKRAAATKKKHDQRDVVVGAKRTEALKAAAKPPKKRPTKKAAPAKQPVSGEDWDPSEELGANVARLRENGVTWRQCAVLANANGHDVPWPDGGRLLRAMKKHLNGDPAPTPKGPRKKVAGKSMITKEDVDKSGKSRDQLAKEIADDLERDVPWDSESTDKELLAYLEGRTITFVSRITGLVETARIMPDGKYTRIGEGKEGRGKYIEFNDAQGPFRAISLDMIVRVS